ncbi:hypothetical protein [Nonomuraea guangzhouensis]|uniref:Uncharacterized protein n=1 Tax=Nonomuraea guangzhouensis TaxID=1291555 RepID=A0ABW4G293_9ACTN|nr:hypothetical protein [Nonomuraea guangzhouensis]
MSAVIKPPMGSDIKTLLSPYHQRPFFKRCLFKFFVGIAVRRWFLLL